MDKKSVTDALRLLAEDDEARSEIAKLKEHLEAIKMALSAGVTRTAIHEKLGQYGLKMTKGSFLNALNKLLKDHNEPGQPSKKKPNENSQKSSAVQEEDAGIDKEDEYQGLTAKQRREKIADKYITAETMNPHLKRLIAKQQEKDNESSSD